MSKIRKAPGSLKTVAFDEFIFDGPPHGGRIICRNTGENFPFNSYGKDKKAIDDWKLAQMKKVFTERATKKALVGLEEPKQRTFRIPRK